MIEQLELDEINITDTMFQGLSEIINAKKEYIINDINALMNKATINFYYISRFMAYYHNNKFLLPFVDYYFCDNYY
jgi:hypothetical protein